MQNAKTLAKHAALVDSMADHLGLDLEEQVMRGAMDPGLIPDLVLRCTNCTDPEGCARLLSATERFDEAPSYCVNRDTLAALAK
ncbi:MAG: DUF6455 family protein [Dinoroseobacter sp.]|nr:DUF6455 family protein [Dinoroseobacter sp.]